MEEAALSLRGDHREQHARILLEINSARARLAAADFPAARRFLYDALPIALSQHFETADALTAKALGDARVGKAA